MVEKSRSTVFFQRFVAPDGRKISSLKRRVRSNLVGWEIKNCTPLWRETNFQTKIYETPPFRSTFGSWDIQKLHAAVARSRFEVKTVQTHSVGTLLETETFRSARGCGAERVSKSKCSKRHTVRALFVLERLTKRTQLWSQARVKIKSNKNWQSPSTFWGLDAALPGRGNGFWTLSKANQMCGVGFAAVSKTRANMGRLKRMCQDAYRMAGAVQETSP